MDIEVSCATLCTAWRCVCPTLTCPQADVAPCTAVVLGQLTISVPRNSCAVNELEAVGRRHDELRVGDHTIILDIRCYSLFSRNARERTCPRSSFRACSLYFRKAMPTMSYSFPLRSPTRPCSKAWCYGCPSLRGYVHQRGSHPGQ